MSDAISTSGEIEPQTGLRSVKWGRYSVPIIGALIIAFFWLRFATFFTEGGIRFMFAGRVTIGFMTLGLLIPLAAGVFDLSVGSMIGFSGMFLIWMEKNDKVPNVWVGVLITLIVCAAWGLINGVLVTKFRINSFIATLGTSSIIQATTYRISDNQRQADAFSEGFQNVVEKQTWPWGQVMAFWYLVIAAILLWWVLEYTPIGRYLFATGGNPEAARLAGVKTNRYIIGALVSSSVLAGLGGVIFVAQQNAASPDTGPPFLFSAFAAAFLGATQFKGRANVQGALLAIFLLAFLSRGLQLEFPGAVWPDPMADGLVLIVAVAAASIDWAGIRRWRRNRGSAGRHPDVAAPGTGEPAGEPAG